MSVNLQPDAWRDDALSKMAELAALPENWDGYGSRRIQSAAQRRTEALIDRLSQTAVTAPQIFPVSGGGIQLEWQTAQGAAELEILPDGSMHYLIEDAARKMCEGAVSDLEIARLIRWLAAQETNVTTF